MSIYYFNNKGDVIANKDIDGIKVKRLYEELVIKEDEFVDLLHKGWD